jgi:hypothetical protein
MIFMKIRLYPIKIYLITPIITFFVIFNLFLIFLSFFWVLFQVRNSGEQVFLHYNVLFGVDRIGDYHQIFNLFFIAVLFFIINFLFSWFFYSRDKMISYFFNIFSIVVNIFIFIASVLLVFINT